MAELWSCWHDYVNLLFFFLDLFIYCCIILSCLIRTFSLKLIVMLLITYPETYSGITWPIQFGGKISLLEVHLISHLFSFDFLMEKQIQIQDMILLLSLLDSWHLFWLMFLVRPIGFLSWQNTTLKGPWGIWLLQYLEFILVDLLMWVFSFLMHAWMLPCACFLSECKADTIIISLLFGELKSQCYCLTLNSQVF